MRFNLFKKKSRSFRGISLSLGYPGEELLTRIDFWPFPPRKFTDKFIFREISVEAVQKCDVMGGIPLFLGPAGVPRRRDVARLNFEGTIFEFFLKENRLVKNNIKILTAAAQLRSCVRPGRWLLLKEFYFMRKLGAFFTDEFIIWNVDCYQIEWSKSNWIAKTFFNFFTKLWCQNALFTMINQNDLWPFGYFLVLHICKSDN